MKNKQIIPKRFLLFAFELGGGHGGTEDLLSSDDDYEKLINKATQENWECYQIYDTLTGKLTWYGY